MSVEVASVVEMFVIFSSFIMAEEEQKEENIIFSFLFLFLSARNMLQNS